MVILEFTRASTPRDEGRVFSLKCFSLWSMLLSGISFSSDLRELSAGDCFCRCLAAEELLLEACYEVLYATDYFLWRKRWKHTRICCLYFMWCCLSAVMTDAFKTQIISCTKEHYCGYCVNYRKIGNARIEIVQENLIQPSFAEYTMTLWLHKTPASLSTENS